MKKKHSANKVKNHAKLNSVEFTGAKKQGKLERQIRKG